MSGYRTQAGQSVLDQLDLDRGFIVKAKLAQRLARSIAEMGLSQREAAALLPIAQPQLSWITRGKLDDSSPAKRDV